MKKYFKKTIAQISKNMAIIAGVFLLSSFALFLNFFTGIHADTTESNEQKSKTIEEIKKQNKAEKKTNLNTLAEKADIKAKAYFAFDPNSKEELLSHNADEKRPGASLTKILTTVIASDLLEPDEKVRVSFDAYNQYGNDGIYPGQIWQAEKLIKLSFTGSSNIGAYALAEAGGEKIAEPGQSPISAFVDEMNKRAQDIGLEKTNFLNPTGLDENQSEAGGQISARDAAKLILYGLEKYPNIFHLTSKDGVFVTAEDGLQYQVENTNQLSGSIPMLKTSKTGFTNLAGGNLVTVFDRDLGKTTVVTVLGSTFNGRFEDVEKIKEIISQ